MEENIPKELWPFIVRIEDIERRRRAGITEQFSILRSLAELMWPDGYRAKDGRRLPRNPLKAFLSSVIPNEDTGCWEWNGSMQTNGYGGFVLQGRRWLAHRWIYLTLKGEIGDGLVIDHKCDNKRCVNISHLEPVTQSVNVTRAKGKPRDIPAFLPVRPHQFAEIDDD